MPITFVPGPAPSVFTQRIMLAIVHSQASLS